MLSEYPQIKPWIDSLQTVGALRVLAEHILVGAGNIFPFVVLRSQRVAEHVETRTCEGNNDNC